MTNYRPYPYAPPAPRPSIDLGPRLRHEIELRVRELSARLHPTMRDHAELSRLKDLLKSGGGK